MTNSTTDTNLISPTPLAPIEAPLFTVYAKMLWPAITGIAISYAGVAGAGYKVGRTLEEATASIKLIEIKSSFEQVQTKLVAAQEKNASLKDFNQKLNETNAQLTQTLSIKNN